MIDATGKVVVPFKYMNVTIGNNRIEGFIKESSSDYFDTTEYYCDIYDYSGKINGMQDVENVTLFRVQRTNLILYIGQSHGKNFVVIDVCN